MTVRLLIMALMMMGVAAYAADPVVSNIVSAQRTDGSMLVDIHYDLADADADTCRVSINVSDDSGLTWLYPCITLTGDAGDGVAPGVDKHAVWDFGRDHAGVWGEDFQVQVIASDSRLDWRAHSPGRYAAHHWGAIDWTNDAIIETVARADLLTIDARICWDNGPMDALSVVERIKTYNPNCRVIGYVLSEDARLDGETDVPGSFNYNNYHGTRPFWSWTTTGDTLSNWLGMVTLNTLDPDCRAAIVGNIVNFQTNAITKFDGVLWDYFPNNIWIPEWVGCEGLADLDQDGIGMPHDPDERAAYSAAQEDIVLQLRAALGEHFIQVFNGVRAQRDSLFAALADGINYEIFPTLKFDAPEKMRHALDVTDPISLWQTSHWCRTEAGGPFLLLENIQRYNYVDHEGVITKLDPGDFFRVIGLLIDGIYPVWDDNGTHDWGWPTLPVSLGQPIGPAVIDGEIYMRQFTFGDVWMEMESGVWPNPFRYRISIDGEIVEELDTPYHYP